MKIRHAFQPVPRWRARGAVGLVLAAVLSMGVLEGVPAYAAPAPDTSLPDGAFEGTSDDPVPVPAAEGGAPAEPGASGAALPEDPAFRGDDTRMLDELAVPPPPPVDTSGDSAPLPVDERGAALSEAARTGQPVELKSETTETAISYAQPDGTVQVQTTAGPVRTKRNGEWVEVDTTLQFTEAGVTPVAVTGEIVFSDGGSDPMALLGDGEGTELSLAWPERLPKPELAGATATYRDVLPQVDLVLTATRGGFQQYVVVNERPDAATLRALRSLSFPLSAESVTVEESR